MSDTNCPECRDPQPTRRSISGTPIGAESYAAATGYVNSAGSDEIVVEGHYTPSDTFGFTPNTPVYMFTADNLDELVADVAAEVAADVAAAFETRRDS